MREIRFKAKSLRSGKWVEGDLLHRITDTCIAVKDMDDIVYYPVDPSTVCQYTGLKDRNGKEVWEHDVINTFQDILYEVIYKNYGFVLHPINKKEIKDSPFSMWITLAGNLDFWCHGSKFDKEGKA